MSKIPPEHIEAAFESLLNSGLIIREYDYDPINPYDGFTLSHFGRVSAKIVCDANVTRACFLASTFGVYETCQILTASDMDQRSHFFKNGTESLRIIGFKNRFSDFVLSDDLTLATTFRVWCKAKKTFRVDGEDKCTKVKFTQQPRNTKNKEKNKDLSNESFYGCDLNAMCTVDSNMDTVTELFQEVNFPIVSGDMYKSVVKYAKEGLSKEDILKLENAKQLVSHISVAHINF